MGHIGNTVQTAFTSFDKQTITGTGTSVYTLTHNVANEQEIEVFVNNVRQEGGTGKAFTVSGNQITFSENIASTDTVYVNFQGKSLQSVVPKDGTVTSSKIANSAVTDAKIDTMAASKLTGSIASSSMPTGSIVQIVSQNFTTGASTTTYGAFVATGKSVSITPTSASNKILLLGSIPIHASGISGGSHAIFSIFRGGVASGTNLGHSQFGMGQVYSTSGDNIAMLSLNHIDTPATTSSVTYEIGLTQRNPGITQTNLCVNNETYNITLMEIVG